MAKNIIDKLPEMKIGERLLALRILGKIKSPEALPTLFCYSDTGNSREILMALWALAEYSDTAIQQVLADTNIDYLAKWEIHLTMHASRSARSYAARVLGKTGDQTVLPMLLEQLHADNFNVRSASIKSLVKFSANQVWPLLKTMAPPSEMRVWLPFVFEMAPPGWLAPEIVEVEFPDLKSDRRWQYAVAGEKK